MSAPFSSRGEWEEKSEDLERLPSHRIVESGLEQTVPATSQGL